MDWRLSPTSNRQATRCPRATPHSRKHKKKWKPGLYGPSAAGRALHLTATPEEILTGGCVHTKCQEEGRGKEGVASWTLGAGGRALID